MDLSAHCLVILQASSAALWSMPGGVHTSSTIAISEPMVFWIFTTFSGVKICLDPSIWDWNVTPLSLIFLKPERENT